MAGTTKIPTGDIVTFEVKVNGNSIPDTFQVYSLEVTFSVNHISTARVVVLDGDPTTGTFAASSSSTFVPGAEIELFAGYDSKNSLVFKGVVLNQAIRINNVEGSVLEIQCRDKAISTVVGRKSASYSQKSDSDIITSILGNYSGISTKITATTTQWPQQVQYYATDWDFILSRAEANGMLVTTVNGTFSVFNPLAETTSVLTLAYGDSIFELQGDLDTVSQLGNVKASAWDYSTQALISATEVNNFSGAGNISSKKLSEVVGLSHYALQTSGALTQDELSTWSKAQLIKSELSKFKGEVVCQGNTLVLPGNFITLQGLGDRFNGDHFVSSVIHTLSEGNWTTEIGFGLSPQWFTELPDVMAPPAAGLLPGVNGLFTATVKKMYEDPDNQYRILIDLPLFDTAGEGLWARQATFYATGNAGAFFLPEVGDEVIVGFLNEDPRFPIILGSLYSSEKLKPFTGLDPNEKNSMKAIVSKSGIQVNFDDENKVFTIVTPQKNTLILSDQDKQITLKDQNSNSLIMSSDGITLKSPKNITVEADESLTLKGNQGVTISSSAGDVTIKGLNIKESAEMEYSAEGSATASVQGGAELTLKGAMVMIN
ncbi:MAG: type VI secretion system tip protein VgrG [Flavobacteriaceae bacterium]